MTTPTEQNAGDVAHAPSPASPPPAGARRSTDWIFVGVLLLAAALRLHGITTNDVWVDEANSVLTAARSPRALLDLLQRDSSPPLYYLLLGGWMRLAGDGAAALRGLSVGFSLLLVTLVYRVGVREFSLRVGRWAALLLALSPTQIFYSQQIRMYTLLPLLALAAWWGLVRYLRDGGLRDYGLCLGATIAALYTHNFAVYVPLVLAVLVLASGQLLRRWRMWALAFVSVALAYAPWLPTLRVQLANTDHYAWYLERWAREGFLGSAFDTLRSFDPAGSMVMFALAQPVEWYGVPAAITGLLALLGVVTLVRERRALPPLGAVWLPTALAAPILAALSLSTIVTPHYVPGRVDQMLLPCFVLIAAVGIASLARILQWGLLPALLVVSIIGRQSLYSDYTELKLKGDMRKLAGVVASEIRPGDVILCTSLTRAPLEYYLRRAGVRAPIGSFPRATARHLGSQNHARLELDRPALVDEARIAIDRLRARAGPGGRLFLLRTNVGVNDALSPRSLASRYGVYTLDRFGRYKLSGTKERVWLSVNGFERPDDSAP